MKSPLLKTFILLLFLSSIDNPTKGSDSLNYVISVNYYMDLSDTYGGGGLFSGGFSISKYWFGGEVSFGHFQSQPTFVLKIPVEVLSSTLDIPFEEISMMQVGAISAFMRPIQKEKITTELLIGMCYGRARYLCFKSVDYSYDTNEKRFTYLLKDYQLVRNNHFGYQVGLNISLYPLKKMGFQLNARIQDLSNGGTFFFVGGGLCFKL